MAQRAIRALPGRSSKRRNIAGFRGIAGGEGRRGGGRSDRYGPRGGKRRCFTFTLGDKGTPEARRANRHPMEGPGAQRCPRSPGWLRWERAGGTEPTAGSRCSGCWVQSSHPHPRPRPRPHPRPHPFPQIHPPSDSFPSHLHCQGLKPAGISISGGSYCAVIKQQLIANRVLLCLGLMRGEKINLVTTN